MKHNIKTQPEPAGLQNYRTANPKHIWSQFQNNDRTGHEELQNQLQIDQRGLCAYCELRLSPHNRQTGHFHPKSDTTDPEINWGLMWDNLWLCCMGGKHKWMEGNPEEYLPPLPQNWSCDENKGDSIVDSIVLSPAEIPSFPPIFQYPSQPDFVSIEAHKDMCISSGIDPNKVNKTIEVFNLSCPRLGKARLETLRKLEEDIKNARLRGAKDLSQTHLPAKWLSRTLVNPDDPNSEAYRKFFTMIRWRLGSAAEEYLKQVNYTG